MKLYYQLNQYLLTRYPVVWNTKALLMLPAALLIHLIFYLCGYLPPIQAEILKDYSFRENDAVLSVSVLISLFQIVAWIAFYLRNNALKKLYPISTRSVAVEYLLVVVILFSSVSYSTSFSFGRYCKYEAATSRIDLVKDANLINIAHHFLAFETRDFLKDRACSNQDKKNQPASEKSKAHYSYLNYCTMTFGEYSVPGVEDHFSFNERANQYLLNGQKDSVKRILTDYLQLCDQYEIRYYLPVDEYVDLIFSTSDFDIIDISTFKPGEFFVGKSDLIMVMDNIIELRLSFPLFDMMLMWLYIALAFSIALFSFRLTRLKEWFLSLVGMFIIAILLTIISVTIDDGDIFSGMLLLLCLIFGIMTFYLIGTQKRKTLSALSLNWFMWTFPFFPVFMFELMTNGNESWVDWRFKILNNCWPLGIVLIMIIFIIPAARDWQSNPEE